MDYVDLEGLSADDLDILFEVCVPLALFSPLLLTPLKAEPIFI